MSYSSWKETVFRVPQLYLGGTINICDPFEVMQMINMPCRTANTMDEVVKVLESDSVILFK